MSGGKKKVQYILILIVVLIPVIFLVGIYIPNSRMPENIGVHNGQLAALKPTPNGVSTQTDDIDKKIEPLPMAGNLNQTAEQLLSAAETYGEFEVITKTENYLHLVFITPTMKYRDDVEFYLNTDKNQVEIRSQSRVGKSDLGLNRKRYNVIRDHYLQKLENTAG